MRKRSGQFTNITQIFMPLRFYSVFNAAGKQRRDERHLQNRHRRYIYNPTIFDKCIETLPLHNYKVCDQPFGM